LDQARNYFIVLKMFYIDYKLTQSIMKKLNIIFLTTIICGLFNPVFSQKEIQNLINGTKDDANYLVGSYVSPLLNTIGSGLNQGWYNTAKNHDFPGFDLTFSVSMISIPKSSKSFSVDNTKLTNVQLTDPSGSNPQVPTIFGTDAASTYAFKAPLTGNFQGPKGPNLPINQLPVPIINIGFGLPKGIEIKLRYVWPINVGDSKFTLFGGGIMHDIKQYLPAVKEIPFDLAVFVGYTKFIMDFPFDNGNKGKLDANAATAQILISKKLSVLTVYGGVGYNYSKVKFDAKGTYDFDGGGPLIALIDPIAIAVTTSGPRVTGGIRLKFGFFTMHGDYTLQKYSSITAGLGISVK
jgi:hypothetical protein